MVSAVNVGSVNMPKMLRHMRHRSSQVRDLTFIRDEIKQKDIKTTKVGGSDLTGPAVSFGYEKSSSAAATAGDDTAYHAASPEIVIPGLTMLQSPIVSRRGRLEKTGHRISGACTFYAPSLDYIQNLDNFKDTPAFSELESYDKLIDIERIIQNPSNITADDSATGQQTIDLSPGSTYPAGYEINRIQFKIKTNTSSGGDLIYFKVTGIDTTEKNITWTATDTFTPTDWVTVDLPLRDIETGDTQEVYIGGQGKTFTATSGLDIDMLKGGVSSSYLSSLIIDISGSASVELKDIYLYKEAEWRIESIKDYRDEYMQISAVRVRGERASRRRAYG
nr:hypothetical protein [uncultured Mediterranean phage uvMED]